MTNTRKDPRLSLQTLQVMQAFMRADPDALTGRMFIVAGMQSGTLYPLLARLEAAGWLTSEREDVDPRVVGRPRRKFYRITRLGLEKSERALAMLNLEKLK